MVIDVIVVVLIIMAAIKGYRLGLIAGIFSYLAFVVGLAAAMKLSAIFASRIKEVIAVSDKWLPFLAFVVVFLFVAILVKWLAKLLQSVFDKVMLGWLNRAGGVLFFVLLYISVFTIFLFYLDQMQLLPQSAVSASQTYVHVQPVGRFAVDKLGYIIPLFKDLFGQLETFFGTVADKAGR